jgi:hypothetical protein
MVLPLARFPYLSIICTAKAMKRFFAGGSVEEGHYVGATDKIGENAGEGIHPVCDIPVSILNMPGFDDDKLTYFHQGRYKQLSQTGGSVIEELVS